MITKLYIFSLYADGTPCLETIDEEDFDHWVEGCMDPKFIDYFPDQHERNNCYFIVKGEVVVPTSCVIKTYRLP